MAGELEMTPEAPTAAGSETSLEELETLLRERRFEEVERRCRQALERNACPEALKPALLRLLGTAHYLRGALGKAIESFRQALKIDPKHTDSAISLSIVYNDIGRYEEARQVYQIANKSLALKRAGADDLLDRKFALKHVELGDLYFKFHRYDDALEDYSRAARLDPKALGIRIKLAKAWARKGFTTRAIQELQQLCHENENFIEARVHLGLMYFSQGNVIDAQMEWERARERDPENSEIRAYLEMARRATETNA